MSKQLEKIGGMRVFSDFSERMARARRKSSDAGFKKDIRPKDEVGGLIIDDTQIYRSLKKAVDRFVAIASGAKRK